MAAKYKMGIKTAFGTELVDDIIGDLELGFKAVK